MHPLERVLKACERAPDLREDIHVVTATYVQQVKHHLNRSVVPLDKTSAEYERLYSAEMRRAEYQAGRDCIQLMRNRREGLYMKGHNR